MHMESITNFDLEMYPDILEMLDGVQVGDVVRISGSFQVKELSDKRFTASFDDSDSNISIVNKSEDSESEDDTDEEEPETEEASG
jgi:hypothetical protein